MMIGNKPSGWQTIRGSVIFFGMILPGLAVYWSLQANQLALSLGLLAVILCANIGAILQSPQGKINKRRPEQTERN